MSENRLSGAAGVPPADIKYTESGPSDALWSEAPTRLSSSSIALDQMFPPDAFFSLPTIGDSSQESMEMLTMPSDVGSEVPPVDSDLDEKAVAPSFDTYDIFRSTSQPAHKRTEDHAHWDNMRSSRDTLYAHELLRSFRMRDPDSVEGQSACDYCRKRKIKVRNLLTV